MHHCSTSGLRGKLDCWCGSNLKQQLAASPPTCSRVPSTTTQLFLLRCPFLTVFFSRHLPSHSLSSPVFSVSKAISIAVSELQFNINHHPLESPIMRTSAILAVPFAAVAFAQSSSSSSYVSHSNLLFLQCRNCLEESASTNACLHRPMASHPSPHRPTP